MFEPDVPKFHVVQETMILLVILVQLLVTLRSHTNMHLLSLTVLIQQSLGCPERDLHNTLEPFFNSVC